MAKAKILIVEDESIVARETQRRLESLGYTVVAIVPSGKEAIKRAAELHPDLVLMDIMLKGDMDGIEAAEQIGARFNIPTVYLTAYGDDAILQRAKITEPFGFILKPFEEKELHTTIEMALYKHRMESKLKESQRWFATTLKSIGDAVIATDKKGVVTFMNPVAEALTEWKQEEALGKNLTEVFNIINEESLNPAEDPATKVLQKETIVGMSNHILIARKGKETPIEDNASPLRDDKGEITGVVLIFRDISQRKQTEAALRESEERYALAVRGANDGLWDWHIKSNIFYFSPRWKAMLGYGEKEIGNSPEEWFGRVHPEDRERLKMKIASHLDGSTTHFEDEYRIMHKDGNYRWALSRGLAVRDKEGKLQRMAGSQTDITERKTTENQLLHDAFHDALTGLPNRALFMDRLGLAIAHSKRRKEYFFAVLFLDLDRFKVVNDSLGHMIGDQLLISMARRLEFFLRPGDTVARLGGDEFAILLDDITDISDATRVAERIQKGLVMPFNLSGHEVFTTASIGIALSATGYARPQDILRDADTAMYRAKALGRARHEVFDTAMHARAMVLLQLEMDLRRAVERQEFLIHYQPIVSLQSGRITGFEALLRWLHPQRGLVYPEEFLHVLEETGLIVPVGWWVLRQACGQMCIWQEQFPANPPLSISVNFSGKQLIQPGLVEQIDQILRETGLDPHSLRLEITESAIMENAETAIAKLLQLKSLNVQLHIDDFGTGYSSLSYLHRFPTDTVKIDRSFVSRMGFDDENYEIVRTIVTLARILGMKVTAEGLETAEQLSQLKLLECEYGQGFYFSRPVDCEAARLLIGKQPQW